MTFHEESYQKGMDRYKDVVLRAMVDVALGTYYWAYDGDEPLWAMEELANDLGLDIEFANLLKSREVDNEIY